MALTADQIDKADDRPMEEVDVPEWGGTVLMRSMGAKARDAWEMEMAAAAGPDGTLDPLKMSNMRAKLVRRVLCGADGKLLFATKELEKLGDKSAAVVMRLFELAREQNGLTDDEVGDMAKNSSAAPDDSTSG